MRLLSCVPSGRDSFTDDPGGCASLALAAFLHPFGMLGISVFSHCYRPGLEGGFSPAAEPRQRRLAPHHGLIHSKILVDVIDAATQNSLPSIIPGTEIPVGRQRPNCPQRGLAVGQPSGRVSMCRKRLMRPAAPIAEALVSIRPLLAFPVSGASKSQGARPSSPMLDNQ